MVPTVETPSKTECHRRFPIQDSDLHRLSQCRTLIIIIITACRILQTLATIKRRCHLPRTPRPSRKNVPHCAVAGALACRCLDFQNINFFSRCSFFGIFAMLLSVAVAVRGLDASIPTDRELKELPINCDKL